MRLKMSSAELWPFCSGINVLTNIFLYSYYLINWPRLVQLMACSLFDATPLLEATMAYYQLDLRNIFQSLQWHHNGPDCVSNHQPHHCLLNRLFEAQIKENIKAPRHWPLRGEFTGDRWIPRTNGQWRGNCFYLMTSSWWNLNQSEKPYSQENMFQSSSVKLLWPQCVNELMYHMTCIILLCLYQWHPIPTRENVDSIEMNEFESAMMS